jgi:hypothetical protein
LAEIGDPGYARDLHAGSSTFPPPPCPNVIKLGLLFGSRQ